MKLIRFIKWWNKTTPNLVYNTLAISFCIAFLATVIFAGLKGVMIFLGLAVAALVLRMVYILCWHIKESLNKKWRSFLAHEEKEAQEIVDRLANKSSRYTGR